MDQLTVSNPRSFWGEFRPPSDKSLTHRAYMLAAIAKRGGVVTAPLQAHDCQNTLQIIRQLGLQVTESADQVRIQPSTFSSPTSPLQCGNSGTTMRLMCGLLSGLQISATLIGDESLSRRPMRRVVEPLQQMGANIQGDTPPIHISPASLQGRDFSIPIASAQVKSAILLAGLFAEGKTSVTEPHLSRDHTERMMEASGCKISRAGLTVTVETSLPNKIEMRVPADISSAAFFLVAGILLGGPVTAREVGINPTRTGLLEILNQCGADVAITATGSQNGEPVGDIAAQKPQLLKPFRIEAEQVPRLIDEIPILCVLATQCEGTSSIRGAGELRFKESDRITTVAEGLKQMGAQLEVFEDGMAITGPTPLTAATISANHDHRIAMAFAIAGLIAQGDTTIQGSKTIATSFPDFESELRRMANV